MPFEMDSKEMRVGGGEISGPAGVSQPTTTPLVSSKSFIPSGSGSQKCTESSPGAPETPKILSRNCNGTVVLTSSPNNEAELQLYRVMQRASLLAYYDTLLEMGGDDVQQLCDAGEEEFLEIMALVGMASKPLHVRRLQKALQEWVTSPALFQIPLTTTVPTSPNSVSHLSNIRPLNALTGVSVPATLPPAFPPVSTNNHTVPVAKEIPPSPSPDQSQTVSIEANNSKNENPNRGPSPGPVVTNQGPGSPLQLTPVLVDSQISKLSEAAEALVKTLPQFEPKPHNAKKKICRELENVMNMAEDDPRRMDELRKYAAIYGRFDCKRNPQKPLTLHEVSVNEAAAQICRFAPALLTRRDDLFSLARQVVRDSGYHYIKGHSSISSTYRPHSYQLSTKNLDDSLSTKRTKLDAMSALSPTHCDNGDMERLKRQERLEQIADELRLLSDKTEELVQAAQQVRQNNDLSSVQSLQQQMETVQNKQTQLLLEQSDLLKQPLPSRFYRRYSSRLLSNQIDSEKHDTDDTDSQFSLSNASSPSQEVGDSRDSLLRDGENLSSNSNGSPSVKSPGKLSKQYVADILGDESLSHHKDGFYFQDSKVQVISASGGNIIAVANPALSMSSVILQTSDSNIIKSESPFCLKVGNQSYENHKVD